MNRIYHNGERIFAHVGRLHVAAIVPVSSEDGSKSYKIIDSWDSSARLIGEYWVLPAKTSKSEDNDPSSLGRKNQQTLSAGIRIDHPRFGKSIIAEAAKGILSIDFGENGFRRLDEHWVRKHCLITGAVVNNAPRKIAQNER